MKFLIANDEGEVKGGVRFTEDSIDILGADGSTKLKFSFNGELQAAGGCLAISTEGEVTTPNATIRKDGQIFFPKGYINADGSASFLNDMFKINTDGSGQMANGKITWDADGNINANSMS